MHEIEPFYGWIDEYRAETDRFSPFFNIQDQERETYVNTIYNFYIHPEWDDMGSPTLFLKILYVHYQYQFAVIELMGEWNDAISNDIMFLKRKIVDVLLKNRISKFMLIGENVLNFHSDDSSYYEEWADDIAEDRGWIALINFRQQVLCEMKTSRLLSYISWAKDEEWTWRKNKPLELFYYMEQSIKNRLG